MAVQDQLRHILVEGHSEVAPYTTPGGGRDKRKLPPRNRQAHGRALLQKLEKVRQRAAELGKQRAAFGLEGDEGIFIQFDSSVEYQLPLKSLEFSPSGIEIASTRVRNVIETAVVFVPHGKISHFIKRVDAYLHQATPKGNPKNERLVASIDDIRQAVLDAFWTDDPTLRPEQAELAWWEVWLLARPSAPEAETRFRAFAQSQQLAVSRTVQRFPDRVVLLVRATAEHMITCIEMMSLIAELRRARLSTAELLELPGLEQHGLVSDLAARLVPATWDAPAVCLLDTGVNRGHPLLGGSLDEADWQTYDQAWGPNDHHGHGTEMAGLALLGDLSPLLESTDTIHLRHRLESVKLLPPGSFPPNAAELYGAITSESVSRAEVGAPERARVVCLTVTSRVPDGVGPEGPVLSEAERERFLEAINSSRRRGRPSAWSAELDRIAAGVDEDIRRLIVMSAGNSEMWFRRYYPESCLTESVHDPAQAWNALTVGAYTDRDRLFETDYPGWRPIANRGEIAPSTTTSLVWQEQWPLKPDVVLEGGNMAIEPATGQPDSLEELQLLSTHRDFAARPLAATGDTSAAAAQAAGMAAVIQAAYPDLWPETIRALLVHSAEWTPAMLLGRNPWDLERAQLKQLLRTCGHGVPSLERALHSARNRLVLIAQNELQPYDFNGDRVVTKDMRLHELPWPKQALEDLRSTLVTLRVTLSYFIEPNPGERGWRTRHRYASHGLRFDVKTPTESEIDFRKRLSKAIRDEEYTPDDLPKADHADWLFGSVLRHKGSIHSDRWLGTAEELAARGVLAVFPVTGWWYERKNLARWDSLARYSLVVSIETEAVEADIYTPVAAEIQGVPVPQVVGGGGDE